MLEGLVRKALLPRAEVAGVAASPSVVECEVVHLFDQYRDPLFRYVVSLGLPVQDTEELVQEVFLALFRHLREGKSRRNLPGWIFSVGHNLALKKRQLNQQLEGKLNFNSDTTHELADRSPDPETQALHRERQEILLNAVQALPERDQCCLRLRAEGLRYREIAGVVGMSLGSVASSLARSLARLMCLDQRL